MIVATPKIAAIFETCAGLLYPPACAACDTSLPDRAPGMFLCAACEAEALSIEPPFCATCSRPLRAEADGGSPAASAVCRSCSGLAFAFDCAVSARLHVGPVRDLIARFKYHGEHHLRRPLAGWLAEALDDARITCQPADALVPVPLHPRRQRERGYNQAEECCRVLGRRTGLPVWPVLRRMRYTDTQTHLTREERLANLRGAFALAGAGWRRRSFPLGGAHLLLVDDVFTSGATVDACARVLRAAGAASVRVLAVARRTPGGKAGP